MKFIIAQNNFDKVLRKTERSLMIRLLTYIEISFNTNNPREFWNYISKLAHRNIQTYP